MFVLKALVVAYASEKRNVLGTVVGLLAIVIDVARRKL